MDTKLAHPDFRHVDESPKPEPVQLLRGDSTQQLRQQIDSAVRDHAYRLYQNNPETHGKDLDHWAEAQARLVSSDAEIRDSGPWFHCNCPVRATPAGQIKVAIDPTQVIIHLDLSSNNLHEDDANPIFYWAKWPQEVDPSTAAAYVLDSNITIEVKKTDPPAANPLVTPVEKPAA